MSNPNPTQYEVKQELILEIHDLRDAVERLLGKAEWVADSVATDFGQGSARVEYNLSLAKDLLEKAHEEIDTAYNKATGEDIE